MCIRLIPLVLTILAGASDAAARRETIDGPVEATVLAVADGDTIRAEARIWPGHTVRVLVRIRGIDAPEARSRCAEEKAAAHAATLALRTLIDGKTVAISNISGEKYFGRVLADVATADGQAIAPYLLAHRFVRPYRGGRRQSWC